jgi:hypothetical protein
MSSSTSSSRGELAALAVAALALLAVEVGIRAVELELSRDLRHLRAIPELARELAGGEGLRVLFLGNSLTQAGVDVAVFESETAARGVEPLRATRVYPDDTTIVEWIHLFRRFFTDPELAPDVMVLSFSRWQVSDETDSHPERLGAFYSSAGDIPEIFSLDVTTFDTRTSFLLARFWAAYRNRERISRRVLDAIPHYRDLARTVNLTLRAQKHPERERGEPMSYARLARLAELASEHDVRVILVAMPTKGPWPLDPTLPGVAGELGLAWVDARDTAGLTPSMFRDGLHLTPEGARVYSRALAERLAPLLRNAEAD